MTTTTNLLLYKTMQQRYQRTTTQQQTTIVVVDRNKRLRHRTVAVDRDSEATIIIVGELDEEATTGDRMGVDPRSNETIERLNAVFEGILLSLYSLFFSKI